MDESNQITVLDNLITGDLKNIENCRSDELVDIFNTQAEILKKKFWTKERTKEFFKCLLEE